MPLTEKQKQLVTDSFARIIPISGKFASLFYERLWDIAPDTKPLFAKSDMANLRKKLMKTIGATVTGVYNLESIAPTIRELGKRHSNYGVSQSHYDIMGDALLWTLEQELEHDFTPEIKEAWASMYAVLAQISLESHSQ